MGLPRSSQETRVRFTNLGDGLAHGVAGLVADPHLLPRREASTQGLELAEHGLVGKHLDSVFGFQAQVEQQVLLHTGLVYAVPVDEEPAEGPQGGGDRDKRAPE